MTKEGTVKRRTGRRKSIILEGLLYLQSTYLVPVNKWPNSEVHWIYRGDVGREMHDHPYPFLAITLRGGGTEMIQMPGRDPVTRRMPRIRYYPATARHRILSIDDGGPMKTVTFTGPRRRMWGFVQLVDGVCKWRPALAWSPGVEMDDEYIRNTIGFAIRKGDTYYSALCRQAAREGVSLQLTGETA